MSLRESLTTGQIAKMIGVSSRMVQQWVDHGTLSGFRMPPGNPDSGGEGDRRVMRADLLHFLRSNKMPIPASLLGRDCPAMLVLTPPSRPNLGNDLNIAGRGRPVIYDEPNPFLAGLTYAQRHCEAVLLELTGDKAMYCKIAAELHAGKMPPMVMALIHPDCDHDAIAGVFDMALPIAATAAQILAAATKLINKRFVGDKR